MFIACTLDRANSMLDKFNSDTEELELMESAKPAVEGNVVGEEGRSSEVTPRHHTTLPWRALTALV